MSEQWQCVAFKIFTLLKAAHFRDTHLVDNRYECIILANKGLSGKVQSHRFASQVLNCTHNFSSLS